MFAAEVEGVAQGESGSAGSAGRRASPTLGEGVRPSLARGEGGRLGSVVQGGCCAGKERRCGEGVARGGYGAWGGRAGGRP